MAALDGLISSLRAVAADVEPEEVKALAEVDDPRLVLVEGQAPGRQPLRQPRLDLLGLLLAVAEHDHVIGVPDQRPGSPPWSPRLERRRSCNGPRRPPPARAARRSAGTGNHPALWSSLLGRREPLARLEHARLQPAGSCPWPGTTRARLEDDHDRCGRTPRPGPRPAPTRAWPAGPCTRCRSPRSRHGSRGPAGTRTIWARTGPPTRAPARYGPVLVAPVHEHGNAERPQLRTV